MAVTAIPHIVPAQKTVVQSSYIYNNTLPAQLAEFEQILNKIGLCFRPLSLVEIMQGFAFYDDFSAVFCASVQPWLITANRLSGASIFKLAQAYKQCVIYNRAATGDMTDVQILLNIVDQLPNLTNIEIQRLSYHLLSLIAPRLIRDFEKY